MLFAVLCFCKPLGVIVYNGITQLSKSVAILIKANALEKFDFIIILLGTSGL